ncbi:hypothetical protein EVAR_39054_1 [Eumeta japonica]|uniref:Uncharacterized protein n=1 Tax=Eumeta variegata TaxID=151549 RepID=A0A4C1WPT1_EUMVA|nr:hypothetical protein EVAR_39054_1 [Eumeta japonica]
MAFCLVERKTPIVRAISGKPSPYTFGFCRPGMPNYADPNRCIATLTEMIFKNFFSWGVRSLSDVGLHISLELHLRKRLTFYEFLSSKSLKVNL